MKLPGCCSCGDVSGTLCPFLEHASAAISELPHSRPHRLVGLGARGPSPPQPDSAPIADDATAQFCDYVRGCYGCSGRVLSIWRGARGWGTVALIEGMGGDHLLPADADRRPVEVNYHPRPPFTQAQRGPPCRGVSIPTFLLLSHPLCAPPNHSRAALLWLGSHSPGQISPLRCLCAAWRGSP